ncbi:unnamed protein product [Sphenostylis stenocarpa]|uniref:Protein FAM32A-like n=1 Tax=Sphenostylis stenocarpa TaxID=92480 RepID=A0AA86TGU1_9FABA|nr:unnamed protein product [Sphenostylis stenocarpa]
MMVKMSPYDNVVVEKLKLKGKALDVKACGVKKKKKRDKRYHNFSQTTSGEHNDGVMQTAKDLKGKERNIEIWSKFESVSYTFSLGMSMDHHEESMNDASSNDHLTPAERRFLHQTRKLELQRLAEMATKSHRDRVHEFNQYLANLSEHYDIPKVGPG